MEQEVGGRILKMEEERSMHRLIDGSRLEDGGISFID